MMKTLRDEHSNPSCRLWLYVAAEGHASDTLDFGHGRMRLQKRSSEWWKHVANDELIGVPQL